MTALLAALALGLGCSLAWATLDAMRKLLVARMDPVALLMWLSVGQVPVLGAWVMQGSGLEVAAAWWPWVLGSIALNIVANLLFLYAVGSGEFSRAIPLLAFVPVWTAVLAIPLLGELPSPPQWLGIAMVVLGAIALHAGGSGRASWLTGLFTHRAAVAMLGVSLAWATTIVLDKRAMAHAPASIHALALGLGQAVGMAVWALRRARGDFAVWARMLVAQAGVAPLRLGLAAIVAALAIALQLRAILVVPVAVLESMKRAVGMAAAMVAGRWLFDERISIGRALAVATMAVGAALVLLHAA
ncbi:MAG: DMT family transporter [Deltaproteobacteria bacterium]|nr:DMT family transporter [Deltaproteobacteria bacterium]MBK8720265.1 DMT family transporter [Deltaproteobacteria bacterium]MBP7287635.1 DMT family transporter [Nannocystaceae bacterium]